MGRTPSPSRMSIDHNSPVEDPNHVAEIQAIQQQQEQDVEGGASNSNSNSAASNSSLWSSFMSTLGVFDARAGGAAAAGATGAGGVGAKSGGAMQWTASVKRAIGSVPVRRLHECILGLRGNNGLSPGSAIWLLGVCYNHGKSRESSAESTSAPDPDFLLDFSSRIWISYRQGFPAIAQSSFTSDVGWGCMIRSGQMLVAQALVCHSVGREWRRGEKPYGREYLEVLQSFGDSCDHPCRFSIHNLITAGATYGLAAGSWIGPYALCHAIEALARGDEGNEEEHDAKGMSVYVVSGEADGERGGAPVLCVDDVAGLSPVLILVPLVLGLDKVNPRYLPSLRGTFTFPQSVGIAGGKPGASVYLVGCQDDQALYLDPHEVQKVVRISTDKPDVDTGSYHCSVVRHMSLEAIDPSLALGFFCKNRDEFDDFCERATDLASQSNGAPMFTITRNASKRKVMKAAADEQQQDEEQGECGEAGSLDNLKISTDDTLTEEEDWQIL